VNNQFRCARINGLARLADQLGRYHPRAHNIDEAKSSPRSGSPERSRRPSGPDNVAIIESSGTVDATIAHERPIPAFQILDGRPAHLRSG
jgi:hypothetical protein